MQLVCDFSIYTNALKIAIRYYIFFQTLLNRRVFDVWHMWRLATHESEDFQKQSEDFHK